MNKEPTITQVKLFWDKNPLLFGEIKEPMGTPEWFKAFDKIKTHDVFLDDLNDWTILAMPGKKCLDVGCGPGYWNRFFDKFNLDYCGVDISSSSVKLARMSQEIFGLKGRIFICNAENLAFRENHFDYIISEGVIHHTPNTQKCIDEIHRVLRRGGTALISVYYKNLVLRSKIIFKIALFFMGIMNVRLAGRGREKLLIASDPDDFVRMYDGAENPFGKSYTKRELEGMFSKFSRVDFSLYYFPWRAMPFYLPRFLKKIVARSLGLMILIKAEK